MTWFLPARVILTGWGIWRSSRNVPSQALLQNRSFRCKGQFWKWALPIIGASLSMLVVGDPALGQPSDRALQVKPIRLQDLPEPPPELAELIKSSKVTFQSGPRPPESVPGPSPEGPSPGGLSPGGLSPVWGPGRRLAAETKYTIAYNYDSQTRWRRNAGSKTLVINLRFKDIQWQPEHRVWFRRQPLRESFWDDRLVRHEFDHVRISSDPRLRVEFEKRLRDQAVLRYELKPQEVVNRKLVDNVVADFVAEQFAEVSELIAIRYQELDRLTDHGLRPLPPSSPLKEVFGAN